MVKKYIDQNGVPLENWDHFVHLSKKFDQKFKTRTMLYYLTLDEIRHTYTNFTDEQCHIQWQIVIDEVFANSNTRISTDMVDRNLPISTTLSAMQIVSSNMEKKLYIQYTLAYLNTVLIYILETNVLNFYTITFLIKFL